MTAEPCLMCRGTGHDFAYVLGEPNSVGIRPVVGKDELDLPCRACRGSGVEAEMDEKDYWHGVTGATEHRTTGGRAWCFQDSTWCYENAQCECCHEARRHALVWLPEKDSDEYVQFAVKLHQRINIASDRGCVLEVLDALWEERE